ncbi:Botulinum neurotoxin type G precursor [Serratia proteamaculans]|uniref:LamG-like jellyroll fold domain-containing protein n=1 Tax=Serratia proteamaculans TaxID=28151 RepID=UPI002183DD38|nr:LamG-like jellyroll fold domain-containing protein [Serratia proteamaculans]CAI2539658.1 Botulinum neurotoxin type G precursor [Serratia proteamaculans]
MKNKYKEINVEVHDSDSAGTLLARIDFNTEVKDVSGNNSIEKITGDIILTPNNIDHDGYFEKNTLSLLKENFIFSTDRNLSLSFWIKSGTSNNGVIISNKDWSNGSNIGWLLGINNDYLVCNWKGESSSRLDLGFEQNIKIADNRWHHVAATFDRQGDAVFYKDGEEVYTINIANSGNIDSGYATVIGADALGKYPLNGCHLDEFEIYDKLLSREEIKQRFYDLKDKLQKPLAVLMNFEGDLKDSSAQGYHGVATGDINFVRGFDGKAVKLAKSYITLPQSELFPALDGDFSVSFWIKTNAQSEGVIFSNKDWSAGGNIGWVIGISGEKLRWNWKGIYGGRLDFSDIPIADFKWHHVAITHNRRGDAIFYIDGQEQKRISIAGSGHTNTHLDFNIGADGLGKYGLENALLDRVQISNSIISPQQVQQEYEAYRQQLVPVLKTLHYSFDGTLSESTDKSYHAITHAEEAYVPSFANSAFLFDGETFITIPNAELQNDLAGDFSLCFWINSPTLNKEQTIIANKDWKIGNNPGWQVGIHENTLSWNWKGSNAGRYDLAAERPIHMADGRWHQITVSHDRAGNACFYKDGVLQQQVDIRSTGDTTTALDVTIGADAKGQYCLSNETQLDELWIINRVVSAQEALAFYEEYRDLVVKPLTEKFNGSLALVGAEQTVAESAFTLNLHLRTENMVNVIDEFTSELHYDPSSFEFIEAIGRDISVQVTDGGILKISGYGGRTFNNNDPLDWQKTKMGELRFKTTGVLGHGVFSLLNSQFYENGRLYQIDSLNAETHHVTINTALSLDRNQDGVITLSDIMGAPADQQTRIAEQIAFMPYKRVLFIGMDGAGASVSPQAPYWPSVKAKKETVGDRLHIPCLRRMIEQGAVSYTAQSVMPSDSAPNWGAILTGVDTNKHGITNGVAAESYYSENSPYPTLFKRLRQAMPNRKLAAYVSWDAIANSLIEPSLGVECVKDYDEAIVSKAVAYIASGRLKNTAFMMVHLSEIDLAGHVSGYYGPAYYQALAVADKRIETLLSELDRQGLREDTLIIVSPDHGGGTEQVDGTQTQNLGHGQNSAMARTIFIAANGRTVGRGAVGEKIVSGGSTKDIVGMVLHALNIPDTSNEAGLRNMFVAQDGLSDAGLPEWVMTKVVNTPSNSVGSYQLALEHRGNDLYAGDMTIALDNALVEQVTPELASITLLRQELTAERLRLVFIADQPLPAGQILFTLTTRRHSPQQGLHIRDAMLATQQGREILPKLAEQTLTQDDPAGLTLNQERVTLEVGKGFTLIANIKAVNAGALNWANTDAEVASLQVNEASCFIKALHPGLTKITVTSADGAYSVYCEVTVVAAFTLDNQGITDKSRWLKGAATPGSTLEITTDSGVSLSGLVAEDGRFQLELPPLLEHSQLYIQERYPHGIKGVKHQFEVRPSYNLLWDIAAKASASSVWFKQAQYTADKAIDGDGGSRWASHNLPLPAWLTVDFGDEINVDLVQIKEYESRVSAFTFEVLQNGQWLPVYQGTTLGPDAKLYFPRIKASQIRLNITAASDLPSIYELQVFDTENPPVREISDSALIELEARKSFNFFWEMANSDPASPGYGLVSDSKQSPVCNVAQVGFALSAIPIGIDNGWITREEGAARTLGTLNMLLNHAEQHKGFFYHFLDKLTGKRTWTSELSTIDTTLALNGVIVAGEYFGGEVKQMADQIYHKVEWPWFRDAKTNQFYLAWYPEKGGAFKTKYHWSGPAEQASMYVLAAASPTHPVSGDMFYSISRDKHSYRGSKPVLDTWFGSSFTNQFSNAWIDFRGKVDKLGDDWFDDGVLNSQISRQYSIDEQDNFKTFGPDSWGLSAANGPDGNYHGNYGAPPATAANTDGTMVLSGAVGAVVFTPKESLAAMQNYYRNHPYTWGKYGFNGSYNLDVTPYWYSSSVNGLEKGISIVMLENYRTGIIWRLYMQNEAIKQGVAAIGLKVREE